MERVSEYADVFTLEEFKEMADMGGVSPYDGTGYYATERDGVYYETKQFDWWDGPAPTNATHVAWYNK